MAAKTFWLELSAAKVDREKGIIHGVSVISQGPAKGHGMNVDELTLSQVHAAMNGRNLKTKLNHGRDVRSVIGTMKNPMNLGGKVVADLHLFKSTPARDYVFELAEEAPDSVGMSIEFEGKDERKPDGSISARCEKLNAVALVDRPAANEGGMFCEVTLADVASVDSPENNITHKDTDPMTPEQIAALSSATETIKALQAQNAELVAKLAAVPSKEELASLATAEVTKAFAAVATAPVAPVVAAPVVVAVPPAPVKTFSDHVADFIAAGMKPTAAHLAAVQKFPELHKEFREKSLGIVMK